MLRHLLLFAILASTAGCQSVMHPVSLEDFSPGTGDEKARGAVAASFENKKRPPQGTDSSAKSNEAGRIRLADAAEPSVTDQDDVGRARLGDDQPSPARFDLRSEDRKAWQPAEGRRFDDRRDSDTDGAQAIVPASAESRSQNVFVKHAHSSVESAFERMVDGAEVVATVNGIPIFACEILDRYAPQLKVARERMPPEKFQQFRRALIERDLKDHIQRMLLVDALKSTLKKEQIEQIDAQLDKYFENEIDRLKKQLKVTSRAELEEKLHEQGTSLANLRDQFANQQLAMEYLRSKASPPQTYSRKELLQYYYDHLDEFSEPASVRWRQIRISFAKHGGKEKAFEVLERCIQDLRNGLSFEEAARRYSDGPTANDGGLWDWTRKGSLANTEIEDALFELPVGEISQVFTEGGSFQIVQVIERKEKKATPFEQVQDQIKKKLQQAAVAKARQQVLEDVYRTAVIETRYNIDLPKGLR